MNRPLPGNLTGEHARQSERAWLDAKDDVLPRIAQGESNKIWIIPSEFQQALGQLAQALPGADAGRARPEE